MALQQLTPSAPGQAVHARWQHAVAWSLAALVLLGLVWFAAGRRGGGDQTAARLPLRAIAVLPLTNLSGDQDQGLLRLRLARR